MLSLSLIVNATEFLVANELVQKSDILSKQDVKGLVVVGSCIIPVASLALAYDFGKTLYKGPLANIKQQEYAKLYNKAHVHKNKAYSTPLGVSNVTCYSADNAACWSEFNENKANIKQEISNKKLSKSEIGWFYTKYSVLTAASIGAAALWTKCVYSFLSNK